MRTHLIPVLISAALMILAAGLTGCCNRAGGPGKDGGAPAGKAPAASFGDDLAFLRKHTPVVLLTDSANRAQVALAPAYQGRIMTSTTAGAGGLSFGWINRELIASGKVQKHINAYGGEDRFWMGPEGGPFSLFFAKGAEQTFDNWQTPPAIDTEPFETVSTAADRATFGRTLKITNASGHALDIKVQRAIQLLDSDTAYRLLGVPAAQGVEVVAFQSDNTLTNAGQQPWTKQTGQPSVWILGMFNPSPATTIVIPFKTGPESELGPVVNDAYFGKVPAERLKIDAQAGVIYFSGDGTHRSKIGLSPRRAKPIAGSYDAANRVLTLVQFNVPADVEKRDYVNSMWGEQKDPFAGDVVNSYNDGPTPTGKPLGPFYEIETSSPAAALAPGQSLSHVHRTIHLRGPESALDPIARKTLGVGLEAIKKGLAR